MADRFVQKHSAPFVDFVDFREAIAKAEEMLAQCQAQPETLTREKLLTFLETEQGARAFFVAFLSGEWADSPPPVLLSQLHRGAQIAHSVLARNLVMSSATEASHRRNGDLQNAMASAAVSERTSNLIAEVDEPELWHLLKEMRKTLIGESDTFRDFLDRQKYTDDEKLAALATVESTLRREKHKPTEALDMDNPFS